MRTHLTCSLLFLLLGLAGAGCDGFGTNCSTDSDCTSKNPNSFCDPTLKVCFVRPGPVVKSIAPADGTKNVPAANAVVTAVFSKPINDAGVTSSTFVVNGQGFMPFGYYAVGPEGLQATYNTYAGGLVIGTNYTVNLTAGIQDLAGNPLTAFSSSFSTADGSWQAEIPYTSPTTIQYYALAASYYGQVVTVLSQRTGTTNDYAILAGVGDPAVTPSPGVQFHQLDGAAGSTVQWLSTDVSGAGQAFAAWELDAGTKLYARAAVYNNGTSTWGQIVDLPVPASTETAQAQVIAEPGNYAEAYWREKDAAGKFKVYGRTYVPATATPPVGWISSNYPIQTDANADCYQLSMATDLGYDLLAVWQQAGAATNQIYVSYNDNSGNGFDTPISISDAAQDADSPSVGLGYGGTGAVAWESQTATNVYHVFARTFDPKQTPRFAAIQRVDTASVTAYPPQVGVAANGDVTVAWNESVGSTGGNVSVSRYTASTKSWSTPEVLVSDAVNFPNSLSLAVDPGGNALVVWVLQSTAFGRRYTVGSGWVPALSAAATTLGITNSAIFTLVVVDGSGYGTVAAEANNGTNNYLDYVPFY